MASESYYQLGSQYMAAKEYEKAYNVFKQIYNYKDGKALRDESCYLLAEQCFAAKDYENAYKYYDKCSSYKDSAEKALQTRYTHAAACYDAGDYGKASDLYRALGNYQDSASRYPDSYYRYGQQLIDTQQYIDAVSVFKVLNNYQDSKAKVNEAMYGYVLTHKSNTDQYTFHYLQELKAANYSDAKAIYAELYQWKVTVTAINTSEHTTTNLSSISKYRPIYIHFTVSGGGPDSYTMLKFKYTLPNGITGSYDFDGSIYYSGSDYTVFWEDGIYTNPYQGSAGTLSFWFYDEDNNLIGQGSVRITN